MHKRFRFIIAGIALITAFSACSSEDTGDATSTTTSTMAMASPAVPTSATDGAGAVAVVTVKNMTFKPATITIDVGETVTWEFDDAGIPHAVQGLNDNGMELSSPILKSGTYSHTFTAAGTYDYICPLHPDMRATVIVK